MNGKIPHEQTIETPKPETQNSQLQSENMEVHHHPKVEKKNFKEYFLEFIMIFLAVTLGFFAESLRESITDGEKEKEYIKSFIHDLQQDTARLNLSIEENKGKLEALNNFISLSSKNINDPAVRELMNERKRMVGYYSLFKSNDATMLQLVNSGGLRLIRKDHAADSIAKYDNQVKIIYAAENLYTSSTEAAIAALHEVFDYSVYYDSSFNNQGTQKPVKFITNNGEKIKLMFNKIDIEIGAVKNYIYNMQSRLPYTTALIKFLKKEYDIDDDNTD